MALQPLNFGITATKSSFTPGLLAGVITVCCGVTAFLSPDSRVSAAFAGSTIGMTGVSILRKRQDQEVKDIVETELESQLALINKDVAALQGQLHQLKTEVKTAVKFEKSANLTIKPNSESHPVSAKIANTPATNFADLIALLNTRNVKVEEYNQSLPVDDLFDNLAIILGEQHAILEPLHYQIIKSLQTGKKFSFNLANSSQKAVGICTNYCQSLYEKSLLDSYYYDKKQKVIHALPQIGNAEITQFFNGGWFERFVYKKVANLLSLQGIKYQYLRNAHVTLKNQDKFELDLLFLVNNELIWIECKSGQQSSSCLQTYCQRRQALVVPKERALLVSLKLSDAQTASWTNLWDITVVNSNNFEDGIKNALRLSDNSSAQNMQPTASINSGELAKFLNKKSLRPLPEHRHDIIIEFIKVIADATEPITMAQVEKKIAVALEISNSKVHDIMNAVIRSNCLFDEGGEIVSSFNTPVSTLLSDDAAVLENKCVETYANIALSLDPNYFEQPHNVCEFEQTVSAQVPDLKGCIPVFIF